MNLLMAVVLPIICQTGTSRTMDLDRLALIPVRMGEFAAKGRIPGSVTLVAERGKIVRLDAVGYQEVESTTPMRTDTIFRIASMTKPVTAAAIVVLADEGRLSLNDPIDLYIPAFRNMKVAERGPDGNKTLRSASRRILVRHLLTHMSGIPGSDPSPITDESKSKMSLAEYAETIPTTPLDSDPGTRISYSGRGTSVAGRIVEIVSKLSFEKFVQQRIFDPLSMVDSTFFFPRGKAQRVAMMYYPDGGKLIKDEEAYHRTGPTLANPAGGMYSTAQDMFRFHQLFLDRGLVRGKRVLSSSAVATMTQIQSYPLQTEGPEQTLYGFGWAVTRGPSNTPTFLPPGCFGHAGATGTYGWGDPVHGVVGVFMTQSIGGGNDVVDAFRTLVGASLPALPNR